MTTELTNDERIRILRELEGRECFCGAKKPAMQTFCWQATPSLSSTEERAPYGVSSV